MGEVTPTRTIRAGYEAYRARIFPLEGYWAFEVYGPTATYRDEPYTTREDAEHAALRFIEGHINGERFNGIELAQRVNDSV